MARISQDLIQKLNHEIALIRLMQSQGYTLTKHGKQFSTNCRFHDDRAQKLTVDPATNEWTCPICNLSGNVVDWVMKTQGISLKLAVEILQNDVSLVSQPSEQILKKATAKKLQSNFTDLIEADDQTILRQIIAFYHDNLKQNPEALEYLKKRGLNHPELVEHFQIGFSNKNLAYRIPAKNRRAGAQIRERLTRLGILRPTGFEQLAGSIVVPMVDETGQIVNIFGRKILQNLRKGTPMHTFLSEPVQLFNECVLKTQREVILCSSITDALTFWVNGFKHVVSHIGLTCPDVHLEQFVKHQVQRIIIAYPASVEGNQAAEVLSEKLSHLGMETFRVEFPKDMDANQFALRFKPSLNHLNELVRKAVWMGKGQPVHPVLVRLEEPAVVIELDEVEDNKHENNNEITEPQVSVEEPVLPPAIIEPIPDIIDSPAPKHEPVEISANVRDHDIEFNFDKRRYRIKGLLKNNIPQHLKVNVLVHTGDFLHVDTVDFYSSKARQSFIKQASIELGFTDSIIKADLAKILLKLEDIQEQYAAEKTDQTKPIDKVLDQDEREAALTLLHDPNLLDRVLNDFDLCGVVGEEANKLAGLLAAVSRKLDKPLAILIQSTSAAGKSSLMDAVLAFMPDEDCIQYSALTGQSLFYMGQMNLKNKILAISEEEGIQQAAYSLKLLQSEGEISIASTGKDTNGNLVTQEYKVEARIMLFITTTSINVDEELLNRCLVLTVNETRAQTKAIHHQQRLKRTLAGLQHKIERQRITNLQQNAQRLLRPLQVINPYADQLTFLDDKTRTRRDHEKYLTLIDAMALLHQYQRPVKSIEHHGQLTEYIEVTLSDIEKANQIAHTVLGRSLDELPPQTRNLLNLIKQMVTEYCQQHGIKQSHYHFTRKQIREYSGWGNTQLKIHIKRLEDMEYVVIHRGGKGQHFEYELLFDQDVSTEQKILTGLIDTQKLTLRCEPVGANHA